MASVPVFIRRMAICLGIALGLLLGAIGAGMLGYHRLAGLGWVDAFLNASMILTGMGPVSPLTTTTAKIFAGLYAIFSGLLFLGVMGIVMAPVLHRLMHRLHVADEDVNGPS